MRPVPKEYPIGLKWLDRYPPELAHLTASGLHLGLDYIIPIGTRILSPVDGIITERGYFPQLGWTVWIKFWVGWRYWGPAYRVKLGHMSKIMTEKKIGDKIRKGELVGLSGSSGASTGPHLHLQCEIFDKQEWKPVNPSIINA